MIDNLIKVVLRENYDVRHEAFSTRDSSKVDKNAKQKIVVKSAYTKTGLYIGDEKDAIRLFKLGIVPEYVSKSSNVCSIGFCAKEQKWYGWSNRAIAGFAIGDMIYDPFFGNENTPFNQHGLLTIRNLSEAKQSAINFAEDVS
jgi:hypothetical protein